MNPERGVIVASRTTLEVGGVARYWVEPTSLEAVREALAWADSEGVNVVVLGGGSNVLVADRGLDALVLRPRLDGISFEPNGDAVIARAGAGVAWDALVEASVARDLQGLECLSGIPGDVGGTPIQNVGAYGQEVADTICEVVAIDRATRERVTLDHAACGFGYRDSVFKRALKDTLVVVEVAFRLKPGAPPAARYAELERALTAAGNGPPSLAATRATVIALRRAKSMVIDPSDDNRRSAGSFFMNPTLDAEAAALVREKAASVLREGERMPEFAAPDGRTKLSAGWLIERAGFARGTASGPVGLSTKHALAVVNRGGASAKQIVAFAAHVRAGVRAKLGVVLHPEPVLLGFAPYEVRDLLGPFL